MTATHAPLDPAAERLRRWRLVLGGESDGTGCRLAGRDAAMDGALGALYRGADGEGGRAGARSAGLGVPRRRWPAGWATSARTSRPPSSS
ncbi:hypothetical protein GCM10025734_36710 [Kitasatospora paranensis]